MTEQLPDPLAASLARTMTRGGDARIALDPGTGLNRYYSAPRPRDVLAFASSTANDLSADAMAWLRGRFPEGAAALDEGPAYAALLESLRDDIRGAYALDAATDIFFAPSGTDLEYVGLLAVAGRKPEGVVNILLGADEVGSGCIHSAAGAFFARETVLGTAVEPGQPVAGLPPIALADQPVRGGQGDAYDSRTLAEAMAAAARAAISERMFPLIHIVHGSKTGLVLPQLDDVDRLRARFGNDVAFVVDACQARITREAIGAYLARGIIVFVTGSKFMGGPPFSGFALLPAGLAAQAAPIAHGMNDIFRRAELPAAWPGRDVCEDSGNAGLALRLAASLFELKRFQALPPEQVARIVNAFTRATDRLARALDVRKVASAPAGEARMPAEHPIEMRTLVTLDLCHCHAGPGGRPLDFTDAVRIHKALLARDIRLGQPVRCVRLANGEWGATLRIGLSMPQISMLAALAEPDMERWLAGAMDRIATALAPALA